MWVLIEGISKGNILTIHFFELSIKYYQKCQYDDL